MGPIIIPNCVEVRLHWVYSNITWFNVLHAQYTLAGPVSPTAPESIFSAIKASAGWTAWSAHTRPDNSLTAVGVRDIRGPNFPELLSTSGPAFGTGPSTPMAPQVCMVVTFKTAQAGRAFRGRCYLSGLDQNCQLAGGHTIDPPANTAAVGFLNAVQSAMAAQSMTLAIGQKALPQRLAHDGSTLPARPANVVPVTSIVTLNTRFDTQRRRLQ